MSMAAASGTRTSPRKTAILSIRARWTTRSSPSTCSLAISSHPTQPLFGATLGARWQALSRDIYGPSYVRRWPRSRGRLGSSLSSRLRRRLPSPRAPDTDTTSAKASTNSRSIYNAVQSSSTMALGSGLLRDMRSQEAADGLHGLLHVFRSIPPWLEDFAVWGQRGDVPSRGCGVKGVHTRQHQHWCGTGPDEVLVHTDHEIAGP